MAQNVEKRKIRIGLVTTVIDNREGRGTALVARELLSRLLTHTDEFEFTLIHHEPTDNPIYEKFPTLLIPHLPAPLDRQIIRETIFWFNLRRRSTTFDIVHYLNARIWPSYLFSTAKEIVFTAHEAGVMINLHPPGPADYAFRITNRFLNFRMGKVIACSEYGRQEIAKAFHLPLSRVAAVPLGVDPRFSPIPLDPEKERRLTELGFKRPYVLSVGRLDPHKNIHRLVEAFGEIHTEFPKVQLALVGGKHLPDYSQKVLDTIERYDIEQSVHLAPFIPEEDLPLVYSAAEAFVYPSVHEGFGLPILEAMACGTPVATGTLTASPETAGDAALLFNPLSVQEIAESLRTLLSNEEVSTDLITRGIAHAKKYSWDAMTQRVMDIYRKLYNEA